MVPLLVLATAGGQVCPCACEVGGGHAHPDSDDTRAGGTHAHAEAADHGRGHDHADAHAPGAPEHDHDQPGAGCQCDGHAAPFPDLARVADGDVHLPSLALSSLSSVRAPFTGWRSPAHARPTRPVAQGPPLFRLHCSDLC